MRGGLRSAVVGNINAWRTIADDMYRPRVLQQVNQLVFGLASVAVNTATLAAVSTATDYTRIQGGYDAKISRSWTVGGQVSYLRGS